MGDIYLTPDELTTLRTLFDAMDEEANTLAAEGGAARKAASEITATVAVMRDIVEQAVQAAERETPS